MLTWWPALALFLSLFSLYLIIYFFIGLKKENRIEFKQRTYTLLQFCSVLFPLVIAYPFYWARSINPADKSGMMIYLIADLFLVFLMVLIWSGFVFAKIKGWNKLTEK